MLKPVDPAAFALLNPPGWSVSPAYLCVEIEEVRLAHVNRSMPLEPTRQRLAGLA